MGINKKKKNQRKRAVVAKQVSQSRRNVLEYYVDGKKYELYGMYKDFLMSLTTTDNFVGVALDIKPKSDDWNFARRRRITASNVKRICSWTKYTAYIFHQVTRQIGNADISRGDAIEEIVIGILTDNGFIINHTGDFWVHRLYFWLSCTIDGAIMEGKQIKAGIEIKSYKSHKSFKKAFRVSGIEHILKTSSQEYYQI